MDANNKTLKDIGIFFVMVFLTVILLAITNYIVDYILTYEAAFKFNSQRNMLLAYFAYFLIFRAIIIMPIYWLFVEFFKGKLEGNILLKIFFIIISAWLVAVVVQNDLSADRSTVDLKRFITYPIAGLIAYWLYANVFSRKT